MKLYQLGLSSRTYELLTRAGITTVEELQQLSEDDLKKIRNMRDKNIKEIKEKLPEKKDLFDLFFEAAVDGKYSLGEIEDAAKKILGICSEQRLFTDATLEDVIYLWNTIHKKEEV